MVEIIGDGERIDVERDRDDEADDEQQLLRGALVPAGHAIHAAVVPRGNVGDGLVDVTLRRVDGSEQHALDGRVLEVQDVGADVGEREHRRGGVTRPRSIGVSARGDIHQRKRKASRGNVRGECVAWRERGRSLRSLARPVIIRVKSVDEGVRVEAPRNADGVPIVEQLPNAVFEKRSACLQRALDGFADRRADHTDEEEDEDDADGNVEYDRSEHGVLR